MTPVLVLALLTSLKAAPQVLHIERLPRIEAKADLRLWRQAIPERLVFGKRREAVFVRPGDTAAAETLRRLGHRIEIGKWQLLKLDSVALLEALGGVGRLELRAARAHRPMLDLTVTETHADEVHAGLGVQMSRNGAGVLVGIIDTGIDLTHPDFRKADGSPRVVAVWDQDAIRQNPPQPFDYGRLCDEAEIAEDLCDLTDPSGHGTHVAGIAAGRSGIAPESDIAVVRSDTFTRLADAVQFLKDLGGERGQPVAINISVGGQYGAHDGLTPLEAFIDHTLGPGTVVAAAAGNDGASRLHVGASLGTRPQRVRLAGVPWGKPVDVSVELWSEPQVAVHINLEIWNGDDLRVTVPLLAHGDEFLNGLVRYEGAVVAKLSYGLELMPDSDLACRTVLIDPSLATHRPQIFIALSLVGTGRIDGWISQSDYRYGVTRFGPSQGDGWLSGDGAYSITVPASAKSVVAVGSYTIRSDWITERAEPQSIGSLPIGALSAFSSRGPTLAPHHTGIKPDLTAPGCMIISSRAMGVPSGFNTIDETRMLLQGTSMAAPHVTGAMALMLEANPRLNPQQMRDILHYTANADHPATNDWGFGKVDIQEAVLQAETTPIGCAAVGIPFLSGVSAFLLLRRRRRRHWQPPAPTHEGNPIEHE